VTFRRRTFPEVLDSVLTSVVGGVAAETHPFPPTADGVPPFQHQLEQPQVAQIVSVWGGRDGQPHQFRAGADYELAEDGQTLSWLEGAELPDPGTLLAVNYLPVSAQADVTDLQPGSVVRTLAESIALEIARLSAQLEGVYRDGFIDTASGSALDKVVALLGVERVAGGRAAGNVRFTRVSGARGAITIPAGTRVMTADGEIEYETTDDVTMADGQNAIRVTARDIEPNDPLAADALTLLPAPIAGIASVTNPAPTALSARDETDAELRTRAKSFLFGSERATLGALRRAVAWQQISADVEEVAEQPGYVKITPHVDALSPEAQQRLLTAIHDTRPAGVIVELVGAVPPKRVALALRLTTADGLTEQQLRAAQRAVRAAIEGYFRDLPVREDASVNRIVGLALAVPEVGDLRLLSATVDGADVLDAEAGVIAIAGFPTVLGELRIADPSLPTVVTAVVRYPQGEAPPDEPAIESALTAALAYLNTLNASELPEGAPASELAKRSLSFGRLLWATPLPGHAAQPLAAFDDAPVPPALPDETDVAPYAVTVTLSQESGVSQVLQAAADPAYALTPFERLLLAEVVVSAEA